MQGKASGNDGRRSNTDSPRRARPADDSAELFVDPAPSQMRAERPAKVKQHITAPPAPAAPARAADRRREKGRAPEPVEAKDTRTSLQQNARRTATVASHNGNLSVDGGVCGAIACVRGPESGTVLSLAPGSYTVGRARENDLVLKDIAASRKHLRLEVSNQGARLVDLGSGNGTKVNGKRAGEVELRHGDTIEIGGSVLVFSASGKTATVAADGPLDEAQARVVAAADVLARELSDKLRFGDENASEGVDGHRAKTRALRSADARAVAEELARQQAARASAPPAPVEPARRGNDRLWNETFTNVPLSAVVPDEQRLQGTARDLPRRPTRAPTPAPQHAFSTSPLPVSPVGPVGTAAEDSRFAPEATAAPSSGPSFVSSVLLSAAVVIAIGTVGLSVWAIFFRDDDKAAVTATDEPSAEYATAITRAQDAFAAKDWAKMRDYAEAALQVRPNDQMAASYKRDAELRLDAENAPAPNAPAVVTPPTPAAPVRPAPPTPAPVAEAGPPAPPTPARVTPAAAPVERATPTPKPNRKPSRKAMSDDEAKSRFERAIDAFRSKDTDTGCQLLEQVADRAPAESAWRSKADTLFLKRCGS